MPLVRFQAPKRHIFYTGEGTLELSTYKRKFNVTLYVGISSLKISCFDASAPSITWVGATLNHNDWKRSPSLARKNKTENGKGNRNGEWNFCQGEEADIVLFLQVTRIRTIRKVFGAKKSIIARNRTITIKQLTLKHRNKQDGSKFTNHKS